MNTNRSWNATARGLHWLMAVLILIQGLVGWVAQEMDRCPARVDAMTLHKSLGLTLLLLLLLRFTWRKTHSVPPLPDGTSPLEVRLSRLDGDLRPGRTAAQGPGPHERGEGDDEEDGVEERHGRLGSASGRTVTAASRGGQGAYTGRRLDER